MKYNIKSILFLGVIIAATFTSCKKDNVSLVNSIPAIPVTVDNLYNRFSAPTVKTSLSKDRSIKIVLSIPASSGRTIKEITRVNAGTAVSSIQTATGLYKVGPIAGNGTTVTFNTTLDEYGSKPGNVIPTEAVAGGASALLAKSFYFMLTLDNGDVIIPTQVRVYVEK